MSEVYNPQSAVLEEIEQLRVEARDLELRRQNTQCDEDRLILDRQLQEVLERIGRLRKLLN